ncbi:hypothetical protein HOD38_04210 [archaeon]|jgi:hypothetical protein|nr:hypothetical protein [archaeon]MBT4397445.1 hypothetical protein [archaeon]MBT4440517.1 hypothetical protein [archaeon]
MFNIKLCKSKGSYEVNPKKRIKLNLKALKQNFETIEDAKIFLIVKIENCEIIIHNYGDLTFKDCKDKEKIEKIAKEIYNERFIIA